MARVGLGRCRTAIAVAVITHALLACTSDEKNPFDADGSTADAPSGGAAGDGGASGSSGSGGTTSAGGTAGTASGGTGGTSSGGASTDGGATGGTTASGGTTGTGGSDASASGGADASASGGTSGVDASIEASTGGTDAGASGGTSGVDASIDASTGGTDAGANNDAGNNQNDRPAVSGTRLKAKFVEGPDGARTYRRGVLYDSQLDIDCVYRVAADGTTRCLPQSWDPFAASFGWGSVVFTDDQCSDGLVWVQPPPGGCAATVPAYALSYTDAPYCSPAGNDLELHAHVYPVGSLLAPPSGPFYRIDGTGACVTGGVQPASALAYSIGAEVPASSFVAGALEVTP